MALTGSPSTCPTVGSSAASKPTSLSLDIHCALSAVRYGPVNGPWYAIAPAHTTVLPIRFACERGGSHVLISADSFVNLGGFFC